MDIEVQGEVVSGMGKGKIFLAIPGYQKRFNESLGFSPFHGTLNLRVSKETLNEISSLPKTRINGFNEEGKDYGGLDYIKCIIGDTSGAVIFPDLARHEPDIIEIISPENLRETFNLKDGSGVTIKVK